MLMRVLTWDENAKAAMPSEDDDYGFFERVMGASVVDDDMVKVTRITLKSISCDWIPAIKVEMEVAGDGQLTYMFIRSAHNDPVYWIPEEPRNF